ncbi:hypothetical protein BAUCODRAFT_127534 [Baudoinia panamericana UAMH 10762]|uniref:Uncharacterized protein n=1 Tax=Baudoinia panamericana (strain UAMH 10762) TaxID=717646 RepID=M2LAL1_BAUPA|nr:uncharacterized protein BAUCODRAFT_127534 [Baudoinia panamericana UAMH 10762]EMC90852.1 hypothetical protein BAUCODRAFT_127534 [Baudoinia panamericana UAMH 10762]
MLNNNNANAPNANIFDWLAELKSDQATRVSIRCSQFQMILVAPQVSSRTAHTGSAVNIGKLFRDESM